MSESQKQPKLNDLFEIATSKINSVMLEIALDLDVFVKLKDKEVSLEEAGALWGMPVTSARVLGQYLCGMGLLRYENGKLSNAPLTRAYIIDDPVGKVMINTWQLFSKGSNLEEIKQKLMNPEPLLWYKIRDEDENPFDTKASDSVYNESRQRWNILIGEGVAAEYDFTDHRLLLDIGGAIGGWCIGIRNHNPHLRCVVFDLPPVSEHAQRIISESEHAGHIDVVGGSFFSDELPEDVDVVLLANILHDWTVEDNREILRKILHTLPAGGVLLVWEEFLEDDWSGSVIPATHAFSVLGSEGKSGWQPAYGEMESLLQEEGFVEVKRRTNLVIGKKSTN